MKYFSYRGFKLPVALFSMLFLLGCASYRSNYRISESPFYLIGDAGNADLNETTTALKALREKINEESTENDLVIFLGDNIYQKGLPPKEHRERNLAEHRLRVQTEAIKNFNFSKSPPQ